MFQDLWTKIVFENLIDFTLNVPLTNFKTKISDYKSNVLFNLK